MMAAQTTNSAVPNNQPLKLSNSSQGTGGWSIDQDRSLLQLIKEHGQQIDQWPHEDIDTLIANCRHDEQAIQARVNHLVDFVKQRQSF